MGKEQLKGDSRDNKDFKITRKEAIKKAGYAAFSAATMMLLLNDPARASGTSDTHDKGGLPGDFDDDFGSGN
jgi:hypothetical protein